MRIHADTDLIRSSVTLYRQSPLFDTLFPKNSSFLEIQLSFNSQQGPPLSSLLGEAVVELKEL
jgi:hypothetical protein